MAPGGQGAWRTGCPPPRRPEVAPRGGQLPCAPLGDLCLCCRTRRPVATAAARHLKYGGHDGGPGPSPAVHASDFRLLSRAQRGSGESHGALGSRGAVGRRDRLGQLCWIGQAGRICRTGTRRPWGLMGRGWLPRGALEGATLRPGHTVVPVTAVRWARGPANGPLAAPPASGGDSAPWRRQSRRRCGRRLEGSTCRTAGLEALMVLRART